MLETTLGTCFLLVALTTRYPSTSEAATTEAELDNVFAAWKEDSEKPGLAVAVVRKGKDVYSKCFGMANLEYGVPLSDKSVFDTASVAKQFTGFAIATLVEEGRLRMDDPIRKYLPELNDLHDPIKIRHLAHHASGLRDVANLFDLGSFGHLLSASEAFDLIKVQTGFNFEAGAEYDYSNSNYVLLALIVERITEQPFSDWCDEHLFNKCGMPNSFANDNAKRIIKNRSVAYYGRDQAFSFDQNNGMALVGSSAVYSTLADMKHWVRHLLETRKSSKVTQRMLTPGKLDDGAPIDYALGLAVHPYRGTTMVEHSGATPSGFRTQVALFPEHEFAFVILSNWGESNIMQEYGNQIIEIYLGEHVEKADAEPNQDVKTIELPVEDLEKFTGKYLFNGEANVTIELQDGGLELELEGRGKMEIKPMSKNRLHLPALRSFLQFDKPFKSANVFELERKIGQIKRKSGEKKKSPQLEQFVGRFLNDELNLVYAVEANAGQLTIHKSAASSHTLVHRDGDQFRSSDWTFTKVSFTKDDDEVVSGMEVEAGNRLRSVKFRRLPH